MIRIVLLCTLSFLFYGYAGAAKQKITVLDIKVQAEGFSPSDKTTLEEIIRAAVTKEVAGKLIMMDKESMYEILKDADIDPAKCTEAECEVDVFRRMQADYGITPVLIKIAERFKLILKLHQSSNGEVLDIANLYGKDINDFDLGIKAKISELLQPIYDRLEKNIFGQVTAETEVEQGGELSFTKVDSLVVTILSEPPEADLVIDNKLIGTTGKSGNKQPLSYGQHKIRLEKADYLPLEQTVQISNNMKERTFTLKLLSSRREIVIESKPEQQASVFINGEKKGATPLTLTLTIGKYDLRLEKEQYLTLKQTIEVATTTKNDEHFSFDLVPNFGLLSLTTEPPGIAVEIDGEPAGTTPLVERRIEIGVHDIEVKDPGYFAVKITKLQVQKRLEKIEQHFALKQKFGGIDIACHDELGSLVVATVYLDGKEEGETGPRFQKKLAVGRYKLKVKTSHRTFEDTVQIDDHGVMYKKEILLNSLSDEELAEQEWERRRQKEALECNLANEKLAMAREVKEARTRAVEKIRSAKDYVLYPALLVSLAAAGGGLTVFAKAKADHDRAGKAYSQYESARTTSGIDRNYEQAGDWSKKESTKKTIAFSLFGLAAVGLATTIYEMVTMPALPTKDYESFQDCSVMPFLGEKGAGVALVWRTE